MAGPTLIASDVAEWNSATPSVVIPSSGSGVAVGQKLLVAVSGYPFVPTGITAGLSLVADTSANPTQNGGVIYLYEGDVTTGGVLDAGDTITATASGSSRCLMAVAVFEEGTEIDSTPTVSTPGGAGVSTPPYLVASPAAGASASDDATVVRFFGSVVNTSGVQITWSITGATEIEDSCGTSGAARNATLFITQEAASAGPVGARSAEATARTQPAGITVVLTKPLDRPIPTITPDEVTTLVGETVAFTVGVTGGTGSGYTHLTTIEDGPDTPSVTGSTTTTPSFVATSAGVYTVQYVGTDDEPTDSLPVTAVVTVLDTDDTVFPVVDITTTDWTGFGSGTFVNLAARLADNTDATGISATNPSNLVYDCEAGPLTPPTGSEPYTFAIRSRFREGTDAVLVTRVMYGVTVVAEWTDEWDVVDIWQQFSHTLTTGQVASLAGHFGDIKLYSKLTVNGA